MQKRFKQEKMFEVDSQKTSRQMVRSAKGPLNRQEKIQQSQNLANDAKFE